MILKKGGSWKIILKWEDFQRKRSLAVYVKKVPSELYIIDYSVNKKKIANNRKTDMKD